MKSSVRGIGGLGRRQRATLKFVATLDLTSADRGIYKVKKTVKVVYARASTKDEVCKIEKPDQAAVPIKFNVGSFPPVVVTYTLNEEIPAMVGDDKEPIVHKFDCEPVKTYTTRLIEFVHRELCGVPVPREEASVILGFVATFRLRLQMNATKQGAAKLFNDKGNNDLADECARCCRQCFDGIEPTFKSRLMAPGRKPPVPPTEAIGVCTTLTRCVLPYFARSLDVA